MSETFIPEPQATPPNGLTLLDIVKVFNSVTGKEFSTRFTNINDLLGADIHPFFVNIEGSPYSNEQLGAILTELANQTLVNTKEIYLLHHLIALITFDLNKQGIELDNKELQENLQTYLTYK